MSKQEEGAVSYWTWSLDYVAQSDKWELIKWAPDEYINALEDVARGTIVIWLHLDRVIPSATREEDENAKRKFSEAFDKVKRHLSMTFHRFMENKTIKLFWCGHEIEPWNPFCPNESKVQIRPTEYIGENVWIFCTPRLLCISRRSFAIGWRNEVF